MYLPAPNPDPIEIPDSTPASDFAALAQTLVERGGVAVVYAPSTTTITNTAHTAGRSPVEAWMIGPAGPIDEAPGQSAPPRPQYTRGEVIAYS